MSNIYLKKSLKNHRILKKRIIKFIFINFRINKLVIPIAIAWNIISVMHCKVIVFTKKFFRWT